MNNVSNYLFKGSAKIKTDNNKHMVNSMTMQYIQHNPDVVNRKLNSKNFLNEIIESKNVNGKDTKVLSELNSFKLKIPEKSIFISIRNPQEKSTKTNSGYQLYWYNGEKYVKIPVLGTFGMDEYQPKNFIGTSILSKEIKIEQPVESIQQNDRTDNNENNEDSDESTQDRFDISSGNLNKVLTSISNSKIEYFSELSKQLNSLLVRSDIKIMYGETIEYNGNTISGFKGIYNNATNTITINKAEMETMTDSRAVQTVLEEIVHAMTVKELNKYVKDGKNGMAITELNAPKYISDIVQLYNDVRNTSDLTKIAAIQQKLKDGVALTGDEGILYSLINIREFVARSLTNTAFQKYLAGEQFRQSGKSRLEKFKDFIFNVLNSLGLKFEKDSATYHAINSTFDLLKDTHENELALQEQFKYQDLWDKANFNDDTIDDKLLNKIDKYMEDQFKVMGQEDLDRFNNLFDGDDVKVSLSPKEIDFPNKTFNFKEEKCI